MLPLGFRFTLNKKLKQMSWYGPEKWRKFFHNYLKGGQASDNEGRVSKTKSSVFPPLFALAEWTADPPPRQCQNRLAPWSISLASQNQILLKAGNVTQSPEMCVILVDSLVESHCWEIYLSKQRNLKSKMSCYKKDKIFFLSWHIFFRHITPILYAVPNLYQIIPQVILNNST